MLFDFINNEIDKSQIQVFYTALYWMSMRKHVFYPILLPQAGRDTRSVGLNSDWFLHPRVLSIYLPIAGWERTDWFKPQPKVFAQSERQTASSRNWIDLPSPFPMIINIMLHAHPHYWSTQKGISMLVIIFTTFWSLYTPEFFWCLS